MKLSGFLNDLSGWHVRLAVCSGLMVTTLWFLLTWQYDFDLSDEGFYWYGAQRVLRGEVPILDFMSYDIGRYYWAAAIMHLVGNDGIFGARLSAVIYQAFGTCLGVYVCLISFRQVGVARWIFAIIAACIMTLWVWPYYKVYDHATSIFIVAMLVLMLKSVKPFTWLLAGIGLGCAAVMGRNHGMYGAVAAAIVITILLFKADSKRSVSVLTAFFVVGIVIGFSPNFVLMLTVKGFAGAFVESLAAMFRYGATNIGLSIPWPWSIHITWRGVVLTSIALMPSIGFVSLLAFPLLCVLALNWHRNKLTESGRLAAMAAVAASIPYAHYAFSRADVTHLTLGIFPALIGWLVLASAASGVWPIIFSLLLLALSGATLGDSQFYLAKNLIHKNMIKGNVDSEMLWMNPKLAEHIEIARTVFLAQPTAIGNFLAQPDMPGLHAIYRAKMPLWEIYSLVPMYANLQKSEIARLDEARPRLIFLSDHALDGRTEYRYSRTHPLIFSWINDNYQPITLGGQAHDADFKVYVPKSAAVY